MNLPEYLDLSSDDGYHNVVPPDDWEEPKQEEQATEIPNVPMFTFVDASTELPYRSDVIQVAFTPEQLYVLDEILKKTCIDNPFIDYVSDEMKMELYEQQTYIREQLIGKIDVYLDEYVINRPYTPMLTRWIKRVGRDDVRKLQNNRA